MDDELAEDVRWLASHPDIQEVVGKYTEYCGQLEQAGIGLRRHKAARISMQEVAMCTHSAPATGATLFLAIGAMVDVNQQLQAAWRGTILQYHASWLELREYQRDDRCTFEWHIRNDGRLATRHLFAVLEAVWSLMNVPPEGMILVKPSDAPLVRQAFIDCAFPSEPANTFVVNHLFESQFAYARETGRRPRPTPIDRSILENEDTPPQGTPLP